MSEQGDGWGGSLPYTVAEAEQERREALFCHLDRLFADEGHAPQAAEIDLACAGDRGGLYAWCARTFRFLLVTRDLADSLAAYLMRMGAQGIVEVGAGRGELTTALACRGLPCRATDDRSWAVRPRATGGTYGAHVLNLTNHDAIAVLRPDTVLCAWMPNGEDWSAGFRDARSVERYVILGTGPGGHEGTSQTWGEHEGWHRRDLADAARGARCRIDALLDTPYARYHTRVVAYERQCPSGSVTGVVV